MIATTPLMAESGNPGELDTHLIVVVQLVWEKAGAPGERSATTASNRHMDDQVTTMVMLAGTGLGKGPLQTSFERTPTPFVSTAATWK